MTAIAYRDGILAADTMAWTSGGHVKVPCEPKIRRLRTGGLATYCGDADIGHAFIAWACGDWQKPAGIDDRAEFTGVVVNEDGIVTIYGPRMLPVILVTPFYAAGAPVDFLWGALHAGASAEEAVRLAIQWTDDAAGAVQVERVGGVAEDRRVAKGGVVDELYVYPPGHFDHLAVDPAA